MIQEMVKSLKTLTAKNASINVKFENSKTIVWGEFDENEMEPITSEFDDNEMEPIMSEFDENGMIPINSFFHENNSNLYV